MSNPLSYNAPQRTLLFFYSSNARLFNCQEEDLQLNGKYVEKCLYDGFHVMLLPFINNATYAELWCGCQDSHIQQVFG